MLLIFSLLLLILHLLSILHRPLIHLLDINRISNLLLSSLHLQLIPTENRLDLRIQLLSPMSHEQNLKGIFFSDFALIFLIVHHEGDEVE